MAQRIIFLLAVMILLAGCVVDDLLHKPDYTVSGISKDQQLYPVISQFLKTRVSAITRSSDKAERARQEVYQERTIQADLLARLQAEGYYDAQVTFAANADKSWAGTYSVIAGPQYKISSVAVAPANYASFLDKTSLARGAPLSAATVLKVQGDLLAAIAKGQCYFSLDIHNEVVLDHKAHTGAIRFVVDAGAQGRFGPVIFDHNGAVELSYLYKLIPWKQGDCFERNKIESFRASLLSGGLFSRADVDLPPAPLTDGTVPMQIHLKERAARSASIGVSYYTDEGPGVTLGWTHRNLFGSAENLTTTITLSSLIQKLSATLTKPFFMRKDQSLTLNAAIDREDTDAYKKFGLQGGAALKRTFTPHLSGTTGINLDTSRIKDVGTNEEDNFALFSFPQSMTYDNRDKALDATKGWLLEGLVSPYVDALGQSSPFFKTQLGARTYVSLNSDLVLAMRVKAGSILGQGTTNIPASERFYSGGGGSVRGFGFQDIGPRNNGEPAGGRGLAEGSVEMRYKLTDTIGAVTFVDAGTVSPGVAPDFKNMAVGAGVGLRYYTGFGPLRFDVGVPVMQKEATSSKYGIYLSIGQAF